MGFAKILGVGVLGLTVATGGGWLAFVLQDFPGSFVSLTGLKCVFAVLLIETVAGIIAAKEWHDIHARNPHVHGAARPADEFEARQAARGKAQKSRLDDRKF